jgi:hypothetical protein
VAEVSAKMGDTKTALDSSKKALAIFTEMASADPTNDEYRQIVAVAQGFFCEMFIKNGRAAESIDEARTWFQKSQEIYKIFVNAGKLSGDDAARLVVVTEEIAKCDAAIARLSGNYQ